MFKEYDVVFAKKELASVPKGTKGTVLMTFDDTHFEVEFVDEHGNTIEIKTVSSDEIEGLIE